MNVIDLRASFQPNKNLSKVTELNYNLSGNDVQINKEWANLEPSPHPFDREELFKTALANQDKNRYPDVLPYEHSRVKINKTGYINANEIPISKSSKMISAQAPTPSTFCDFWQMIWEHKIPVIVMLTKLLERRTVKAHCYWPGEGDTEIFNNIKIEHIETAENTSQLVVRHFKLTCEGEERKLCHIHFLDWPDFGVPATTAATIKTLELMNHYRELYGADILSESSISSIHTPTGKRKHFSDDEAETLLEFDELQPLHNYVNPTIVVHCSAGIGRAGAFLAIQSYCELIKEGKHPLIKDIVIAMRRYRMSMVQTKDQYKFIYRIVSDLHKVYNLPANNNLTISTSPSRRGFLSESHG